MGSCSRFPQSTTAGRGIKGSGPSPPPLLLPEIAEALVDQLGGQEVARGMAADRGQLDQVHGDNRLGPEEVAQEAEGGVPVAASRLRGARRGDQRGVEVVDVEGEVDLLRQV